MNNACASLLGSSLPAKFFRILLVFSLVVSLSFQTEMNLAFGDEDSGTSTSEEQPDPHADEPNPNPGEENPPGSGQEDDNGPGTNTDPDPGTDPPLDPGTDPDSDPESYAYIKTIEILQESGEEFPADEHFLSLEYEQDEDLPRYTFSARVIVVPDSNNEAYIEEYLITPDGTFRLTADGMREEIPAGLSGQYGFKLEWKIYVEKNEDEEQSEAEARHDYAASIDKNTGELSFTREGQEIVRCISDAGRHLTESGSENYVSSDLLVTCSKKQAEESEPPTETEAYKITYDANTGAGEMEPTAADEEGVANVADCAFEAPNEDLEFDTWNTMADGTGESHAPESQINLENDLTLYAQWKDKDDQNNEEEQDNNTPSLPDDTMRVIISYTPAPKGQPTTLSAISSGVKGSTFAYFWEVSSDEGTTWDSIESDSAQALTVQTNDENIGKWYRVKLVTERTDDDNNFTQEEALSEPIVLRAADNSSAIMLTYEPVEYGQTAHFQITSTESDATYEWLVSKDGGVTWSVIDNALGMTFAVETVEGNLGNWYQVRATLPAGRSAGGAENNTQANTGETAEGPVEDTSAEPTPGEATTDETAAQDEEKNGGSAKADKGSRVIYSNAQMLVARVPEYEVVPGRTEAPVNPPTDDSYEDTGAPFPEEISEETPYAPEPSTFTPPEYMQQDIEDYGSAQVIMDDGNFATVTPVEDIVKPDGFDPAKENTIIADNSVAQEITGDADANVEQITEMQPGSKWRAVSILPDQETIQQVLDDNPFAPLVLPFVLALLAAGMVEKFLAYQRQRRPFVLNA